MHPTWPSLGRIDSSGTASFAETLLVAGVLRAEALVELMLFVVLYRHLGGSWLAFAGLFLVPDLGMAGYLVNRRIGANVYNLFHTYLAPGLMALGGFVLADLHLYLLASIWAAHIGFDRFAGFGLKYPTAFGATHLSRMGYHGSDKVWP